jgi:uncharacterized protein (TIGR03790 family)
MPVLAAGDGTAFGPEQLGVIVNDADPLSRRIGAYYQKQRRIPPGNLVHVSFRPGSTSMRPERFERLLQRVREQTPPAVQAYAVAWTTPYRVGCMSITTALAAGYDRTFCATGCKPTRSAPTFDADSRRPFDDFGWRPAMLLAGSDFDQVRGLIDRGTAADSTHPPGRAYLLSTGDKARNTRARFYRLAQRKLEERFEVEVLRADTLQDRDDVMFYFTGLARVPGINSNRYRPGAVADHLTSSGGRLTDSRQMSSLRWLEAGVTASYGTVVEPCAFTEKFPRPDIVMTRYLEGETLIEAYWKSVAWPGQGVFIGEPLAAPFARVEHKTVEPAGDNPFAPKVLPVSSE